MAYFRIKPVIIEAIQVYGNFTELEEFVGGDAELRKGKIVVASRQGALRASDYDWIIKGPTGRFSVVSSAEFDALFEEVD